MQAEMISCCLISLLLSSPSTELPEQGVTQRDSPAPGLWLRDVTQEEKPAIDYFTTEAISFEQSMESYSAILPQMIFKFNTVPIRNLADSFVNIDKLIP